MRSVKSILIILSICQSCSASNNDYLKIAIQKYESKDYLSCISSCNKAIEVNKKNMEAYEYRGLSFIALKEYEKAQKDFEILVKSNENDASSWNNLANAYEGAKDYQSAMRCLNQAIVLSPNFPEPYISRGVIYMQQNNNLQKACQDFNKALDLGYNDPEDPELLEGLKLVIQTNCK